MASVEQEVQSDQQFRIMRWFKMKYFSMNEIFHNGPDK